MKKSSQNSPNKYLKMSDKEKKELLNSLYHVQNLSWAMIAERMGTYTNKVRRDAIRLGIKSKTKSEAQSLALKEGRHPHPTKDVGHTKESKIKISESMAEDWDSMSEKEREEKRKDAQKRWAAKSDAEIKAFRQAAGEGVRKAAKDGSILEKYILHGLVSNGYKVEFHKEHWVIKDKLQIDLFLPNENIAIEVDGPTHFQDIWGQEVLMKNKIRDNQKNGLLLQRGSVIIRVRQTKAASEKFKRDILQELLDTIRSVVSDRPSEGNRLIKIGE